MFHPKCVASSSPSGEVSGVQTEADRGVNNYFRSVQWTGDGTSLLASPADNSIQTFIVPPDLLDEAAAKPHGLSPYCTIPSKEPVNSITGYPLFNLGDPLTALVLSSVRDHPIRLNSALTGHLGASYPLVNPMTEAYISPHSLLFGAGGARFVAGSESLISVFDVSRPGQEPLSSIPTGPKRRNTTEWNAAVDMRGIVSALAIDATTGTLAAGTYGRQVGLYDAMGQGGSIAVFSVKGTDADAHIGGGGVTQVSWSPCGRYLYIAERKSNGIVLYDIRQTGHLLAWLEGRNAQTNQRLGFDVVTADGQDGHEVWAGGMDGYFRVWENPHTHEGSVSPTFEFKGHEDVVSGATVHQTGGVLATCSGQRHFHHGDDEDRLTEVAVDNSLKIWAL